MLFFDLQNLKNVLTYSNYTIKTPSAAQSSGKC
jgi:hypothetical protein